MQRLHHHFINGQFVASTGDTWFDLHDPATETVIGQVLLGSAEDTGQAIAAAGAALPAHAASTVAERVAMLGRLRDAMTARRSTLHEAVMDEYGAPGDRSHWMVEHAVSVIDDAIQAVSGYHFEQQIGSARVRMQPVGVTALITPWNSNASFILGKLAMALAAGCTAVVKPSEMSALQTQVVMDVLQAAQLPPGVANIVNGSGEVVGAALLRSPRIAKVSFTGSTATGRTILRASAEHFTRVTLELGGKSPTLILDDADPATAAALAVQAGFINSGQACIAGTRILVPAARKEVFEAALAKAVAAVRVGPPRDPRSEIGPMVSERQWQRVQHYIRTGIAEGARVLVGGEGRPAPHENGWFVRPTLFVDVHNDMVIAREEIFGPVLSVITYRDDEEAIAIANDTAYGLSALVIGTDPARVEAIAPRIQAGRVLLNGLHHEPSAPFGGMKQSGIGRESGVWGLQSFLEAQTLLA